MGSLYSPICHRASWRLVHVELIFTIELKPISKGLEAVIFVGGVSLGQPATAIPIATIVGLFCGFFVGFLIYEFASRTSKEEVFLYSDSKR